MGRVLSGRTRLRSAVAAAIRRGPGRVVAPILGVTIGVRTDRPVAALTFDDGPDPHTTTRVLDLLDRYDAKGTFFVVGERARAYPELLARMRAGGHGVGSHGFRHASLPRMRGRDRRQDLRTAQAVLGRYAGDLFRPPYGHLGLFSRLDVAYLGLRPVTWTGHCEDWRPHDASVLASRLRRAVGPGAIVLLHDRRHDLDTPAAADRGAMIEALATVLGELGGAYRFVTVEELLTFGPARKVLGWRRGNDAWLASLVRAPTD